VVWGGTVKHRPLPDSPSSTTYASLFAFAKCHEKAKTEDQPDVIKHQRRPMELCLWIGDEGNQMIGAKQAK